MKTPHPWQYDVIGEVDLAWQRVPNVLLRADTGAGKTVMLSYILSRHQGAAVVMAHRNQLVGQISNALADMGVHHDLIAAEDTRRAIAQEHVALYGRCFYRPGAQIKVASVDTLIRAKGLDKWAATVTLGICDEAHHAVRDNKWGRAIAMFSHAAVHWLFPTATPERADGKGLGSHADGFADAMVSAPPMRWLIDHGYLTDYDIVCPTSDLVMLEKPGGGEGDWSPKQLRDAARRSHIVGDVVAHYLRFTGRRRCITFCTDVETANETTAAFNVAGVPTAVMTGDTDPGVRRDIIRRLITGQLLNICAVDIISEGFDLPAVEVVIMARPTQSLALYMQQFGRALRVMAGKFRALIIDCVGNFAKPGFGPPDRPRNWTLDRRDKRAKTAATDATPYRVCIGWPDAPLPCLKPYERIYRACPYCGYAPEPAGRSAPEQVEGDLGLLDPAVLAVLQGRVLEVERTAGDVQARLTASHMPALGVMRDVKRHVARQAAQAPLREAMGRFGGQCRALGYDDVAIQRLFWQRFGVDVASAMTLYAAQADELRAAIDATVING